MNLLHSFITNHLPTAKKDKQLSKSIIKYLGADKIFVIGFGNMSGIITDKKKVELLKEFKKEESKVYFFTLFDNKEDFQKYSDMISWGSYVWIVTEPEHTIHFDNRPKLKARYSH